MELLSLLAHLNQMLKVSFCDLWMAVVHCWQLLPEVSPLKLLARFRPSLAEKLHMMIYGTPQYLFKSGSSLLHT